MFGTKNNARNALHLPKSLIKAITHILQIVTYAVREKGIKYKGEQGEVW